MSHVVQLLVEVILWKETLDVEAMGSKDAAKHQTYHHHTYISNAPITLLDKNIGAVQSSENGKKTKQSMVK